MRGFRRAGNGGDVDARDKRRVVLHSLRGRAVAHLPTTSEGGFIPGGRFPAGTYLLRAYAPNGHVDARIIIGSQR